MLAASAQGLFLRDATTGQFAYQAGGNLAEGIVFFAMELLNGHDLHDEVSRARLAGQRVAGRLAQFVTWTVLQHSAGAPKVSDVRRSIRVLYVATRENFSCAIAKRSFERLKMRMK